MAWNDPRPMSPHLQIYDLPTTAKLSVLHRGTGAALMAGMVLLVIALATAAGGESAWQTGRAILFSWFGKLVIFGFTVALYYHFCNGVRHLWWDLGRGLDKASTEKSAKVVLGGTAVLTVITWLLAF